MIRNCIVVLVCLIVFCNAPVFAADGVLKNGSVGFGPSDWTQKSTLILLADPVSDSGKSSGVKSVFVGTGEAEVLKGKMPKNNGILEIHVLNFLADDTVKVLMFLGPSPIDKKKHMELGRVELTEDRLEKAVGLCKDWVTNSLVKNHKAKDNYKTFLLEVLDSKIPSLMYHASNELFYVGSRLDAADYKTLARVFNDCKDLGVRDNICFQLIKSQDQAYLPVWIQAIGESENPISIVKHLKRFKRNRDKGKDTQNIHGQLDIAIHAKLLDWKNAPSSQTVSYINAVGPIDLQLSVPLLKQMLVAEDAPAELKYAAMLNLAILKDESFVSWFEKFNAFDNLPMATAAYTALGKYGDKRPPRLTDDNEDLVKAIKARRTYTCQAIAKMLINSAADIKLKKLGFEILDTFKGKEKLKIIVKFFAEETDLESLKMALKFFRKHKNKKILKAKLDLMERDLDEEFLRQLLISYYRARDRSVVPGLWLIVKNDKRPLELRRLAIAMLIKMDSRHYDDLKPYMDAFPKKEKRKEEGKEKEAKKEEK